MRWIAIAFRSSSNMSIGNSMLWSPHVGFARFRTTAGVDRCQTWGAGSSSDGNTRNRPTWRIQTAAAVTVPDAASVKSKLSKLNDSQMAAAMHLEGPCRVIAGPGSGKTRVLVSRIANLIESGASPSQIMAITFTRKAGAEMKERLNDLLGPAVCKELTIGTYHSICGSILRRWIKRLPGAREYTAAFTTATDQDILTVLTQILTYKLYQAPDFKKVKPEDQIDPHLYQEHNRAKHEQDISRKTKRVVKVSPAIAKSVLNLLKRVLTTGMAIWPGGRNRREFFQELAAKTHQTLSTSFHNPSLSLHVWPEVMAELFEELEASNSVWIGMYIPLVNSLLASEPELLELMEGYRYVLVDEVQDNERAQYEFVSTICQRHENVFFVGDLDQAIYQFRGADANLFQTECKKTFPQIRDYGMFENYRSISNIVDVAEAVANAMTTSGGHLRKEPTVMRPGDLPVVFTTSKDQIEEAENIVEAIKAFLRSGVRGSEIAVLYPKHLYGDLVEMKLLQQRVAYRRYGNTEILDSAVGKDLLAYMVLAANPLCSPALNRVFNKPTRGIGQAGWQQLQTQLAADPAAPTLPAFLFQDLDDVWVAPELLDECDKQDEMETAAVRLREMMQQETKEGNLAPEIDYTAANLHKKPTVRQRQALQGLRNLLVCVSSEAARYGPERAMAVLQMLSGYRENLLASGDQDAIDKADFFVRLMRDSIVDPAGGALGVTMEGAWDRAATLPPGEMAAAAADALPEGPPRGSYSSAENEDYFYALLAADPPQMHDYDPSKTPREHAGMELVRACADSMAFLESGPDREPSSDTLGTLGHREDEKVQLMTMHKSKGLEFRAVILLGLSQWGMALGRPGDGDEYDTQLAERNLLYVAVTRAKDALVLSSRLGLNLQPGKFSGERYFGKPSWLLRALYSRFDVELRRRDECEDAVVPIGPRWAKKQVLVANSGYPVQQGWDRVEMLAERMMDMQAEP